MKQLFFILLLTGMFSDLIYSQTLHGVLCADTENKNSEFAASCLADLENMKQIFFEMSVGAGYKLQLYEVKDNNFKANFFYSTIEKIQADTNDVIFIFFAGNAFCDGVLEEKSRNKNRILCLGYNSDEYFSTTKVYEILKTKEAELKIIFIDACSQIRQMPQLAYKRSGVDNKIYKSLFRTKGTISIFSSQCKEYSFCDINGGLFTNAFIHALNHFQNIGSQNLKWQTLLDWSKNTCIQEASKIFRQQHPVYFLDINYSKSIKKSN